MRLKLYNPFKRNNDGESKSTALVKTGDKKPAVGKKYKPKPDPTRNWIEVKMEEGDEPFTFTIPDDLYLDLMSYMLIGGEDEVEGSFNLNTEEMIMDDLSFNTVGVIGGVHVKADEAAEIIAKNEEEGRSFNGQWHSHGTMQAFWSRTDTDDQFDAVSAVKMIVSLTQQPSSLYFMCVGNGGLDCKIRHVIVQPDGDVLYRDGWAKRENGQKLYVARKNYSKGQVYTVGKDGKVETVQDGLGGYGYYGGNWGQNWWRDGEVYFPEENRKDNRAKSDWGTINSEKLSNHERAKLIVNEMTFAEKKAMADLYDTYTYALEFLVEEMLENGDSPMEILHTSAQAAFD